MHAQGGTGGRRLDPGQALEQVTYLRELVEETRIRVADWYAIFLMWGAIWITGYLATFWWERTGTAWLQWTWPTLLAVATVGHAFLGRGLPRLPPTTLGKRLLRMNLMLAAAFVVLPVTLGGISGVQMGSYAPFALGIVYVANGMFVGTELVAIGAWLLIAATAGPFLPEEARWLWMAGAGGGSLLVTGVLLHRRRTVAREHS